MLQEVTTYDKREFWGGEAPNFTSRLTELAIRAIAEDTAPWMRNFDAGQMPPPPMNPAAHSDGIPYHGAAALTLALEAEERGVSDDPRWMPLLDGLAMPSVTAARGKPVELLVLDDDGRARLTQVYHASQFVGMPPYTPKPERSAEERAVKCERILQGSGFSTVFPDEPQYGDGRQIHLISELETGDARFRRMTAELCRISGRDNMLHRPHFDAPVGTEAHARETLIRALASYGVGQELGIGHTGVGGSDDPLRNRLAQQWIEIIQNDPSSLMEAIQQAETARDMILSFDQEQMRTRDGGIFAVPSTAFMEKRRQAIADLENGRPIRSGEFMRETLKIEPSKRNEEYFAVYSTMLNGLPIVDLLSKKDAQAFALKRAELDITPQQEAAYALAHHRTYTDAALTTFNIIEDPEKGFLVQSSRRIEQPERPTTFTEAIAAPDTPWSLGDACRYALDMAQTVDYATEREEQCKAKFVHDIHMFGRARDIDGRHYQIAETIDPPNGYYVEVNEPDEDIITNDGDTYGSEHPLIRPWTKQAAIEAAIKMANFTYGRENEFIEKYTVEEQFVCDLKYNHITNTTADGELQSYNEAVDRAGNIYRLHDPGSYSYTNGHVLDILDRDGAIVAQHAIDAFAYKLAASESNERLERDQAIAIAVQAAQFPPSEQEKAENKNRYTKIAAGLKEALREAGLDLPENEMPKLDGKTHVISGEIANNADYPPVYRPKKQQYKIGEYRAFFNTERPMAYIKNNNTGREFFWIETGHQLNRADIARLNKDNIAKLHRAGLDAPKNEQENAANKSLDAEKSSAVSSEKPENKDAKKEKKNIER